MLDKRNDWLVLLRTRGVSSSHAGQIPKQACCSQISSDGIELRAAIELQEVVVGDMEIVSEFVARLRTRLGDDRFELWFGGGTRCEWAEGTFRICADSAFRLDRLRRGLIHDIQGILNELHIPSASLAFLVEGRVAADELPATVLSSEAARLDERCETIAVTKACHSESTKPSVSERPSSSDRGEKSAQVLPGPWSHRAARGRRFSRLEDLHVGDCNRVAFHAAESIVRQPGVVNPVLFYGPCGAGKTHLLEGIWSDVRRRGGRRLVYLSAEQFTTYFLQALRGGGLPNFRQKYREVDLLLIDDLQFFVGKQATISELLHTIDSLLREGRQVVMAADRAPAELRELGSELQARILGGLVCGLQPLDVDTRRRYLAGLLEQRSLEVAPALVERMVARIPGDARQVAGVVHRLAAVQAAYACPLDASLVEPVLQEYFPESQSVIRLDDIQRVVCAEFGIDPATLCSGNRSRQVSHPRMLAMWLARKHTRAALTEIGDFFGRRSHSTVVSAQSQVERWVRDGALPSDARRSADLPAIIERIERSLRA